MIRVLCSCKRWLDWAALPTLGHQDDGVERLELKNCPHCGSTRALVVDPVREALVDDTEPTLSGERDTREIDTELRAELLEATLPSH